MIHFKNNQLPNSKNIKPFLQICLHLSELILRFDKISESGRNIYKGNHINQALLEIDFVRTCWNELGRSTL